VPAKKKITRKTTKQYPKVRFESDLFDGTFELPDMSSFPLKVQRKLMEGDVSPLFDLLTDAKVSEDAIEAIDSLSGDEAADFMGQWGNASTVPAGESGD
jgi:hypothetical protein